MESEGEQVKQVGGCGQNETWVSVLRVQCFNHWSSGESEVVRGSGKLSSGAGTSGGGSSSQASGEWTGVCQSGSKLEGV